MNATTIDFRELATRADLRSIIDADLGAPKVIGGKPHWYCPWHADGNPSLYVFNDGRRWRCWPCGISGDALDWLTRREGLSVVEAARVLDPSIGGPRPARRPPPTPVARPTADPSRHDWRSAEWQREVEALVTRGVEAMWSRAGKAARQWLNGRGLDDHMIRRFRLGYLDQPGRTGPVARPDGSAAGLGFARGIAFPWLAPGASGYGDDPDPEPGVPRWVGVQVRRLADDPFDRLADGVAKCQAVTGSARGNLYPYPSIQPSQIGPPALLTEGEIDTLLAFQSLGHAAHVGTVGGATQRPDPSALAALALCPWWLLAFDHDTPGVEAATTWTALAPHKARRLLLPHGDDIGEFVQGGGDLAAWLASEFDRLGVVLPPDGGRPSVDAPRHILRSPVIDGIEVAEREACVHVANPIPGSAAVLADRTIGVVRPDPPRDLDDLAGKPLDSWRHLAGNWGDTSWLAWNQYLGRRRTGIEGPDDLDLLERRAFDSVLNLPETVDPRPPMEAGSL